MAVITPRKVFGYSAAATAGYTLTSHGLDLILSLARALFLIALVSFGLLMVCVVGWFDQHDPWWLIYGGIWLASFIVSAVPLWLGFRLFVRTLGNREQI